MYFAIWSGLRLLEGCGCSCPLIYNRPIRLTQCCTQFRSLGVKVLCVSHLHDNIAFTFKWYGNTWNKTFYSQRIWIGYNIELAELVYCCETGITSLYLRWQNDKKVSLSIWRFYCQRNSFASVTLSPWVLVQPVSILG